MAKHPAMAACAIIASRIRSVENRWHRIRAARRRVSGVAAPDVSALEPAPTEVEPVQLVTGVLLLPWAGGRAVIVADHAAVQRLDRSHGVTVVGSRLVQGMREGGAFGDRVQGLDRADRQARRGDLGETTEVARSSG